MRAHLHGMQNAITTRSPETPWRTAALAGALALTATHGAVLATNLRLLPLLRRRPRPRVLPALAVGATALGALAVGALSVGALAIGALAIGRLSGGVWTLKTLRIGSLQVDGWTLPSAG
ncbi:MAG TPA: hypothetical protein VE153_07740 [Myxococcus sp.]|nr:hypothetical protein [Myxococcus sp.]